METVTNFIFLGSKITADGDCSIFKSRDITLPTKVRLVKAMVFPVVMYGCESWTVKKTEHRRIDAFGLWCWRLLRVPWTSLVAQTVKHLSTMWETWVWSLGLIPGLGRFPGEGNGNPLQYSCLENPMDGGAWWATVHRVTKSWTRLSDFTHTHTLVICL